MSTKSYLITLIWCCKAKKNGKTCSMNLVCLPLMLNSNNTLTNLTKADLVDLGIAILGNIKTIRNLAQLINPNSNTIQTFPANLSNASNNTFINASNTIFMKAPCKIPTFAGRNDPFRVSEIQTNWDFFKMDRIHPTNQNSSSVIQ